MCGIAGKLYFDRQRRVEPELVCKMADVLKHRGPDDSGVFIDKNIGLGFRRLSIIDLSSAAHQPMSNENERIWAVFNGEIYNFIDLKAILQKKGHIFKSHSDTEVLIHAYEEYGCECVKKFNGMFAFAVWDSNKQELFCGRDRAGEKPFYYYCDQEKFLFASEPKSILQDKSIEREIEASALNSYFSYMYIPEPLSIFKGFKKLPPAHTLSCREGGINLTKYWDIHYSDYEEENESQYAQKLLHLLTDAVKIRMYSDVPLGIFLSGGIDSSSITSLAAGICSVPVKTFSISGGEGVYNELPYSKIVAEKMKTQHFMLNVTTEDIKTLLPKLIRFIDEPFADSSIVPTYYVSKLARQNVTVALSGEGSDEVFGGYPWYMRNSIFTALRNNLVLRKTLSISKKIVCAIPAHLRENSRLLTRFMRKMETAYRHACLPEFISYDAIMRFFPDALKTKIISESARGTQDFFFVGNAYKECAGRTHFDKALFADINTYLPGDLLTKVDRMSMANSLEVRAPFLDYRVIELGAAIPHNLKFKNGFTKYILRKAVSGCVPEAILRRKDKRGFNVPIGRWFRNDLRDFVKEILLDSKTIRRGIFLKKGAEDLLNDHYTGKCDYGHQIWTLLVFELWAREYMEQS